MEYQFDGVTVWTDGQKQNRVIWMSDWRKCDEFVKRGYFTSKFYGPSCYGETSFFVKEA